MAYIKVGVSSGSSHLAFTGRKGVSTRTVLLIYIFSQRISNLARVELFWGMWGNVSAVWARNSSLVVKSRVKRWVKWWIKSPKPCRNPTRRLSQLLLLNRYRLAATVITLLWAVSLLHGRIIPTLGTKEVFQTCLCLIQKEKIYVGMQSSPKRKCCSLWTIQLILTC